MSNPKSAAKVVHATKETVFRACDALVNRGEKPTVEAVRLHLGGGSPNTVGPLLIQWFSVLGSRLSGVAPAEPQTSLPAPVLRAFETAWSMALDGARESAAREIGAARDSIAQQRRDLEQAQANLQHDREVHQRQVEAAQQAMIEIGRSREEAVSRAAQAEEARNVLLEEAGMLRDEVHDLRGSLAAKEASSAQQAEVHAAARLAWDDERRAMASTAASEQRRLMLELDSAKTGAKTAAAAASAAALRAQREVETLKDQLSTAQDGLAGAHAQVERLTVKLTAAARPVDEPVARTIAAAARRAHVLRSSRRGSASRASSLRKNES